MNKIQLLFKKHCFAIAAFFLSFLLTIFISPDAVVIAQTANPLNSELAENPHINTATSKELTSEAALTPSFDNLFRDFAISVKSGIE